MSLTSYRAAPPRVGWWCGVVSGSGVAARRRPTLPQLGLQYHGRWGVSRPSSGWDRVLRPRDGHRATGPDPALCGSGSDVSRVCGAAGLPARWWAAAAAAFGFRESGGGGRSVGCPAAWPGCFWSERFRAIRTARLRALLRFHLRPIHVLVWHGPRGDLVWRGVSRLDAFSGYPVRAWLPGGAAGATTGAPEARPSRSSRTGDGASQVSCTHGR